MPQAAIKVGDRRAEDVDIGRVQHTAERIVAGDRGTVGDRGELEDVAVEEDHDLAATRSLPYRMGQVADASAHCLLLELGPIDKRSFGRGVAEDSRRGSVPEGRGGSDCRFEGCSGIVPRGLESLVSAISILQPDAARQAGRRPSSRKADCPMFPRRTIRPCSVRRDDSLRCAGRTSFPDVSPGH